MSKEKKENTAPVPEQTAPQPEVRKEEKNRSAKKSIIVCIAVFVIALLLGGPASGLLNKLTSGITVIKLDWSALFKLAMMLSALALLGTLIRLAFARWKPKSNHSSTMATLANSAIRYIIALVGILWGLSILGVDVNALLAGAGVVALIIGFGAESLIADVITGIFMLFEHQYEVGDIIVVGDFRGTVTQIGIRTTSITDSGGNTKIINNSDVRNLINRSTDKSVAVCDLVVPYNGDTVRKAEQILDAALLKLHGEQKEKFKKAPERVPGIQELRPSNNAAVLRVVAEVDENDVYSVQRLLNRELFLALEDAGITNPSFEVVVQNRN